MGDQMDEHYYDEIKPVEKLSDLTEFLKEYYPQVHTCKDEGYEYLEEGDFCITLKNQSGKELYIDIDDEFTLIYDVWHGHYGACLGEYEDLKFLLQQLLDNKIYIF